MSTVRFTELTDPKDLSAAIAGLDDAAISALAAEAGIDAALDHALGSMAARFDPQRASGRTVGIQWVVQTAEGEKVHGLVVEGGSCQHVRGRLNAPTTTLTLALPTFIRLIAGRLHGLQAFSDGKLQLTGDTVVAQLQQTWFNADLSEAKLDIKRPSELRHLLAGRSDDEINAGIEVTGEDMALDMVFQGMVDHFMPKAAGRKRAVIQFSVRTPGGDKRYFLSVDRGQCRYERGQHPDPNVTLMLRLPTFLRIVSGELDGLRAVVSGRIKVKGNILLARALQNWFDRSA